MNLEKEIQYFKDANYRIPLRLETAYKRKQQFLKFVINPRDKLPYPNPTTHERELEKRVTDIFRRRVQNPADLSTEQYLTSRELWYGWNHKGQKSYAWEAEEPQSYTKYAFTTEWREDKNDADNPPYEVATGIDDENTTKVYEMPFNPDNVLKLYNRSVKATVGLYLIDDLGNGTSQPIKVEKLSTFLIKDFGEAVEQAIRDQLEKNPMAAQALVQGGQQGGQQPQQGQQQPPAVDPELVQYLLKIKSENESKTKKESK